MGIPLKPAPEQGPGQPHARPARAFGTGRSITVDACQVCGSRDLERVIFVGYLPPVNTMPLVGTRPAEQPSYPADVLRCPKCGLVQLGLIVDPQILFPPEYPYTSGTTRLLRENFAELAREVGERFAPPATALIVDIGSNDGTLLRNFLDAGHRVRGVEPTEQGRRAAALGIPTDVVFFDRDAARSIVERDGRAAVVTAANVFAHIEDVHEVVESVLTVLAPGGVFITESHYWRGLVDTLQYDTIYHEHLRYYTVQSLAYLLAMHGLEIFQAKRIPTHGGSIRVYAGRSNEHPISPEVARLIAEEAESLTPRALSGFRAAVSASKLDLLALLRDIRARGQRVFGVGAPSRATTLITYVGVDDAILDAVAEIRGSQKIGKYMPGTLIPVVDENVLFAEGPEFALMLSWHISDELMPKLRQQGYRGRFILPLPDARIV